MHQQLPKREEDNPIPGTTKTTSNPWENEANNQKRGMKDTGKTPAAPQNVKENGEEKMENVDAWQNDIRFWALSLPRKSEHVFPKMGLCPIRIWFPILFPFHAITNSTTFWQK